MNVKHCRLKSLASQVPANLTEQTIQLRAKPEPKALGKQFELTRQVGLMDLL